MVNEEYEQGWARLHALLVRDEIPDGSFRGMEVKDMAYITELLKDENGKEFLAAHLAETLIEGLSSGQPLRKIDLHILDLRNTEYFSGTGSEALMVGALQKAFSKEKWDQRPISDLQVIAFKLIDLGFDGTNELWFSFYDHFKGDPNLEKDAFFVYVAGASQCGVDEFFTAIKSQRPGDDLDDHISMYLPGLANRYPLESIEMKLDEYLQTRPKDSADYLRRNLDRQRAKAASELKAT